MIDFTRFPSPCYIMEEELLRKNLNLIKSVADRAGVEIILAFKSFAMWRSFSIFREYIAHSTASSVYEARLALEEFGSKAHTYSPAFVLIPNILRLKRNYITLVLPVPVSALLPICCLIFFRKGLKVFIVIAIVNLLLSNWNVLCSILKRSFPVGFRR